MVQGKDDEARTVIEACRAIAPYLALKTVEPLIRHAQTPTRDAILEALATAGLE